MLPIPVFRGIGIGGLVIPVVSVLVTITLLPIILAKAGPRLDWPRFRSRKDDHIGWARFASWVIRHRWSAALVGLALLGALTLVATQMELGQPRPDSLNGTGGAQLGLEELKSSGIDAGVLGPFEIITSGDANALAADLRTVDGVKSVIAPSTWTTGDTSILVVTIDGDGSASDMRQMTGKIREVTHADTGNPLVGGAGAFDADFTSKIYDGFPMMLGLISLITFLLLLRAFRSVLLPIKALALNVLSIGASFGVLVLVWQNGWGSELIWGIPATGAITSWVPIMAFAFLFGLSMDYEVFLLHRMREAYDRHQDTDHAVVSGLAHTGKLVTCAALILVLAFVSMGSGPETTIKIIATVLAVGILLDATVVRVLLVPALISLMGSWNWWMPRWLKWFGARDEHLSLEPQRAHAGD
jgi:RND superfamily putative drug exporter